MISKKIKELTKDNRSELAMELIKSGRHEGGIMNLLGNILPEDGVYDMGFFEGACECIRDSIECIEHMTREDKNANKKYIGAYISYFMEYAMTYVSISKEFSCFQLLCIAACYAINSDGYDFTKIIEPETGEVLYDFDKDTPEMVFEKVCKILRV